jgi:hypothetical protein
MNTYTVTVPGSEPGTIEAHDWVHNGGLVIFQDDIGRCLVAIAVEDGLRIDCAYGNDELFDARVRLAAAQREVNIQDIEDEVARLTAVPNREQRRHGSGRH